MKDMKDFIKVYKGIVRPQWCDIMVDMHKDSKGWAHARCGADGGYHPDIRNCSVLDLSDRSVPWHNPEIDKEVCVAMSAGISKYISEFPLLGSFVNSDNGYLMMRYNVGEKVANHIDVGSPEHRILSISIQLNDGFEGGKWKFWGQELEGIEKGDVVVFPSNFCFEHEVSEVTSGTRYSILSFFRSMGRIEGR